MYHNSPNMTSTLRSCDGHYQLQGIASLDIVQLLYARKIARVIVVLCVPMPFSFCVVACVLSRRRTFVHCISYHAKPPSVPRHNHSDLQCSSLLLGGGLGEVGEGLAALELGVLDHTCREEN